MANKLEGEVDIVLDKRRTLKMTFRGCAMFEQWTGGQTVDGFFIDLGKHHVDGREPTQQEMMAAASTFRIDRCAALLAAFLYHDEKRITPEDAMDLMEHAKGNSMGEKISTVMEKLVQVYQARQGFKPKEGGEAAGTPAADPRGTNENGNPS